MGITRRERHILAMNAQALEVPHCMNERAFALMLRKVTIAKLALCFDGKDSGLLAWYKLVDTSIARRLKRDSTIGVLCVLLDVVQLFAKHKSTHGALTSMLPAFKRVFAVYSRSTPHLYMRMMRILFEIAASHPTCCARVLGETTLQSCERHEGGGLTMAFLAHIVCCASSSFDDAVLRRIVILCANYIKEDRSVKFMSSMRMLACIASNKSEVFVGSEATMLSSFIGAIDHMPIKFLRKRTLDHLGSVATVLLPHSQTTRLSADDVCAICLEAAVDPCHIVCGHFFCSACVRRHLCSSLRAPVCPMCRRSIGGKDIMCASRK